MSALHNRLCHLLGLAGLMLCAGQASALQVYVDQTAQYRYINATGASVPVPANWYAVGFSDSSWNVGNGPFSSSPTSSTIFNQGNASAPFAPGPIQPIPSAYTQWDVSHDPLLRTYFTLSAPTALTIWIAVDNGIGVNPGAAGLYVNGVQTTNSINAEGNAFRWEVAFDVPANYTFAGQNLIALQLEDHGGLTGFDMMVTAQSSDPNIPGFSTNPPPTPPSNGVPEPASLALLGLGLAALGLGRRKFG